MSGTVDEVMGLVDNLSQAIAEHYIHRRDDGGDPGPLDAYLPLESALARLVAENERLREVLAGVIEGIEIGDALDARMRAARAALAGRDDRGRLGGTDGA